MAKGWLKGLIKTVLIGGGTVLSLLCPPVGGAVVTAGMAIGAGAVAAGGLIKTNGAKTVDTVTSHVTETVAALGLTQPAGVPVVTGTGKAYVISPVIWVVGIGAVVLLFLKNFFKRGRRR